MLVTSRGSGSITTPENLINPNTVNMPMARFLTAICKYGGEVSISIHQKMKSDWHVTDMKDKLFI